MSVGETVGTEEVGGIEDPRDDVDKTRGEGSAMDGEGVAPTACDRWISPKG